MDGRKELLLTGVVGKREVYVLQLRLGRCREAAGRRGLEPRVWRPDLRARRERWQACQATQRRCRWRWSMDLAWLAVCSEAKWEKARRQTGTTGIPCFLGPVTKVPISNQVDGVWMNREILN